MVYSFLDVLSETEFQSLQRIAIHKMAGMSPEDEDETAYEAFWAMSMMAMESSKGLKQFYAVTSLGIDNKSFKDKQAGNSRMMTFHYEILSSNTANG